MEMTFEDKFKMCFQFYQNIIKPDYTSTELNLYVDFIELIAIFSNDDGISMGDIQDKFFGEKEYNKSRERDDDESFLLNLFIIIHERTILYKDDYPFEFVNNEILKLKESIDIKQKLYISLLLSSKLNIFSEFEGNLTSEFELICQSVLTKFLPHGAVVKSFGKNSEYSGNAIKKITDLSKDIRIELDEYELNQINPKNNQERGLDIIGWIPFDDNCMNKVVFLAQCACGKIFEYKQHDTKRFANYFKFYKSIPQHLMFIPYSLIKSADLKFYHSDLIEEGYIFFERKRIISLFDDDEIKGSISFKIVDQCLTQRKIAV